MGFPPKFAQYRCGFALYVFWTWGAAAAITLAAHWLWRGQRAPALVDLPLLSALLLPAGTFAPGAASYLGLRLGRDGRATGRHLSAGRSAALTALGAETTSGLLFCGGMVVYGALSDAQGHAGGVIVGAVALLALGMLFVSLLGSLIPCILGSAIGIAAGKTLRCGPNLRVEDGLTVADGGVGVTLRIAGFAAVNVGGLLCVRLYDGPWIWYGATTLVISNLVLLRMLVGMLFSIVLLGNLWACVIGLWFVWLDKHNRTSDWRTWIMLVPLVGLATFGVWDLGTSFFSLAGH